MPWNRPMMFLPSKSKSMICTILYWCLVFSLRVVMGNLEDLKDYHRKTILPKLEEAVQDAELIRFRIENEIVKKK